MSRIVWDEVGSRFYETGISKGVLYPQDKSGQYPKGVAWNGLRSINESPSGAEPTDLYADNIKYATMRSSETLSYTIAAYTYPDEWAACDGSAEPVDGLKIGQQPRVSFGISYVTEINNDTPTSDDDGQLIHLLYGSTAAPSERNYQTINDSPEAIEFSWEATTTPVSIEGYKASSNIVIDTRKIKKLEGGEAKLKQFEDIIWGTDDAEPRLPLPDEIISIFKTTTPVTPASEING